MKLEQDTLGQYFSLADSSSSWHQSPTNTFDFVDRNSNTLVVTIGDSWTWGGDLSLNNKDCQYRRDNVYGNLVAKELNADWLNLGLCAQGNFWIASMAAELASVVPSLEYQHIYVICTFTGTLRWFNTKYDQHIDYLDWFKRTAPDFDQLPRMLNQLCVNSIINSLSSFNHVTLKIGTGFVDAIGFESLSPSQILPDPWYKLLGCNDDKLVYTCVYYETISQAIEFIEPQHHAKFKQWLIEIIDKSKQRIELISNPRDFRNYHPLAPGHRAWAQYILKHLL
jgi:hypothetical protein